MGPLKFARPGTRITLRW